MAQEKQHFEDRVLKIAKNQIVTAYLDGIILCQLKNNQSSGYDLLKILSKKLNVLISPGTMYSTLYYLERQGFIECLSDERKRVYQLTEDGKNAIDVILNSKQLKDFLLLMNKEFFAQDTYKFILIKACSSIL
ncbi:MAG: PadR family transcriptional regulator [Candidatus Bathyarchaeia archaeon]